MKSLVVKTLLIISVVTLTGLIAFAAGTTANSNAGNDLNTNSDPSCRLADGCNSADPNMVRPSKDDGGAGVAAYGMDCPTCALARATEARMTAHTTYSRDPGASLDNNRDGGGDSQKGDK